MPAKVKVKIISGKDLPVMDRSSDTTDAYVEIKLGNTTYKTDVCRKSLSPCWNTDWYRFEVDDTELQDEPLQIRLMDHDTYSANDSIGKVYLNLNPLVLPVVGKLSDNDPHHEFSGWIPVYDTMHGIRGEVNITVKIDLFSDLNRFRQSSCGVHFFYSSRIPFGYQIQVINGFVEELLVDDDPEYQWIDKIRTPRASNEARQTLFFKLSGELQRKIGLKAVDLGANAVIGYRQCFDFEGESGIVIRGIGTAVTLFKTSIPQIISEKLRDEEIRNYLKFVGDGSTFRLNPSTVPKHHSLLFPSNHINYFADTMTPFGLKLSKKSRHYALNSHILTSISNPSLNFTDTNSLKMLLNQEDKRSKSIMYRRYQKFKDSQKSLLNRMSTLRSRLSDSIGEEGSDGSLAEDNSSLMANVLAKSVANATSSLVSVLEDQKSYHSEEKINITVNPLSDDIDIDTTENISDGQCSSSDLSSSDSDSDSKDDRMTADLDTLSNIISNVERIQKSCFKNKLQKQFSLPAILTNVCPICEMNRSEQSNMSLSEDIPMESNLNLNATSTNSVDGIIDDDEQNILEINNLLQNKQKSELHSSDDLVKLDTNQNSNVTNTDKSFTNININPNNRSDPCNINKACITSNRHQCFLNKEQSERYFDKKIGGSPDFARFLYSSSKYSQAIATGRRSSDSDLSITPKGNSILDSDRSFINPPAYLLRNNSIRQAPNQQDLTILEYPFVTVKTFPPKFIRHIAGSINARSVKLLEPGGNVGEESRSMWWSEIRMEVRSHARSLNCNVILGYSESASIFEDVCVLSACGTAAVIDYAYFNNDNESPTNNQNSQRSTTDKNSNSSGKTPQGSPMQKDSPVHNCVMNHIPFDGRRISAKSKYSKCAICQKGKVPEVLIASIEPPENIPKIGKGCLIDCHVLRMLKDVRGEALAKEISDGLPFLEYELHRLLINKLKIKGMNAVFKLDIRITIGEKMLIGLAVGTAVYLASLPPPDLPALVTNKLSDEKRVAELQDMLNKTVAKNKELYQIVTDNIIVRDECDEDSDEESNSLELPNCFDGVDCSVLEMDDPDDEEVLSFLIEESVPDGFHVVSTDCILDVDDLEIVRNLQMFTQFYRAKLVPPYSLQKHFMRILQSTYFKLRRMIPCVICSLVIRLSLPEPDEIQLCIIGMALGLGPTLGSLEYNLSANASPRKSEDDLIFKLDEDQLSDGSPSHKVRSNSSLSKYKQYRSPSKCKNQSYKVQQRFINLSGKRRVDITPLTSLPGTVIKQYLGNMNFFFIRETTSVREEGGLSGFIHTFITEVLAIVRSHVIAMGGNALVAFFLTECVLSHNLHKNQGQCLINVGGDVVLVAHSNSSTST